MTILSSDVGRVVRLFAGLSVIDPGEGVLSEPEGEWYRRRAVDEDGCAEWSVSGAGLVLRGAFLTSADGRVEKVYSYVNGGVYVSDGDIICVRECAEGGNLEPISMGRMRG